MQIEHWATTFIKKNLPAFKLSRKDSRIALVVFDSEAVTLLPFTEGIDSAAVLFALKGIKLRGEPADISNAFQHVEGLVDDFRTSASKVVVLFTSSSTNGVKTSQLLSSTSAMKKKDIKVITVGIGRNVNPAELKRIAVDPTHFVAVRYPTNIDSHVSVINSLLSKLTGRLILNLNLVHIFPYLLY